jgi:hypothetical protein
MATALLISLLISAPTIIPPDRAATYVVTKER